VKPLSIRSGAGQAFVPAGGENGRERSPGAGAAQAGAAVMWRSVEMRLLGVVLGAALVVLALTGCGGGGEEAPAPSIVVPTGPTSAATPSVPSGVLVFRAEDNYAPDIYRVNADGSELVSLTDSPARDYPGGLSPDGTLIAFTSGLHDNMFDSDVYVMSPDGTGIRNLTNSPAWEAFVSWSPDGSRVLFSRNIGPVEYWIGKSDGTDQVRITEAAFCAEPDWSPDGSELVACQCASLEEGGNCQLLVVDTQGKPVRLLMGGIPGVGELKWSPDGQSILFIPRGAYGRFEGISVMNADGSDVRSIYSGLPNYNLGQLAVWSPDGSQIAIDTGSEILAVPASGGNQRTVATGSEIVYPAWSPDGNRIAYISEHEGVPQLYVVGAEGGDAVSVSSGPVTVSQVYWSRDGKQLLFASGRKRLNGYYWISLDGSEMERIQGVSEGQPLPQEPPLPPVGGCQSQSYDRGCVSPDGRVLAALEDCGPRENGGLRACLMLTDLGTGTKRDVTPVGVDLGVSRPAWSPDGESVAFYGSEGDGRWLYVLELATGEVRRLVEAQGVLGPAPAILWSPDGSYMFYVKGMICGEGCASGFLYRVRADGTGEEQLTDLRVSGIFGFAP